MNPDIILQIFFPCKATGSWQVYVFLKSFIFPFRNFKSRILNMFWFICYFLLILLDSQSLITCPISAKEEPVFFFFSYFRPVLSPDLPFILFFFSSDSVSLGELVHFRLCYFLITTNLSLNLNKIKFTCLDGTYPFLYRLTFTLTMKNRDEKAMFVLIKKLALLLR